MDLVDQLAALASRSLKQLDNLKTEEATKMALVAPFINALGYNVFDPSEVVPEFIADVGIKKGEKVDYAIMKDGKVILLFECKVYGVNLDNVHREQLYRYFSVTEARIGVLTDGVIYRFYTDLEEPNKMDEKPFLEFNLLDLDHSPVSELKKLTKSAFNLEEMLPAAWELKYIREFKRIITNQLKSPDDDFVRVLAKSAYSGVISAKKLEQFKDITKQALKAFITEQVNSRLQIAMAEVNPSTERENNEEEKQEIRQEEQANNGIVTTEEELEAYHIVRAILSKVTNSQRITHKDTKSYFNILLENNSWKPLCRMYFNSKSVKRMGLFDKDEEYKVEIESVSDIYRYTEQLTATFTRYDQG
jgi:hypothetical protein